jgi:hypothetical protein
MNSKQFLESTTTSGAIASVSTPVGKTQTRGKGVYPNEKGGNLLTGKKTNKKFANTVKESEEIVIKNTGEPETDEELYHHHMSAAKISLGNAKKYHLQQAENLKKKLKNQGVAEGSSTDDKKQISKYEELALAANRAGDDEKCKLYQKKIQALKQKMSKKIEESKLDEEDIIIVPGQGNRLKPGLITKDKDRTDHEVEMALSDLFQSAKNAKQVYEMLKTVPETVGIEGWVQEKIIKASDYLNTVREYLEHKQVDRGMTEESMNTPKKKSVVSINNSESMSEGLEDDFSSFLQDLEKNTGIKGTIRKPGEKQSTKPEYKPTPVSAEERERLASELSEIEKEMRELKPYKDDSWSKRDRWSALSIRRNAITSRLKDNVEEGVLAKTGGALAIIAALMGGNELTSAKHTPLGKALATAAQQGDQEAAKHLANLDTYIDTKQSALVTKLSNKYLGDPSLREGVIGGERPKETKKEDDRITAAYRKKYLPKDNKKNKEEDAVKKESSIMKGLMKEQKCPECGGKLVAENELNEENKDACYQKVKSRYKVWPSAYASGALVQCRKKGASNWGNKSK